MKLHHLEKKNPSGYTTWGCMWKQGACTKASVYLLRDEQGEAHPMQTRITAYWPDGSVKWTAHTADAHALTQNIEVTLASTPQDIEQARSALQHKIEITEKTVKAGRVNLQLSQGNACLFDTLCVDGKVVLQNARPVLILEQPETVNGCPARIEKEYTAQVEQVQVEDEGPLQVVLKFEGVHVRSGEAKLPFIIRLKVGLGSGQLDVTHTFLYDGDEEKDWLKGIGVRFDAPMQGPAYNRHVKFQGDHGCFHEVLAHLVSWRPRLPEAINAAQMRGQAPVLDTQAAADVAQVLDAMPIWSEYDLCQDSANHFAVRKKLAEDSCCYLDCLQGQRTNGAAAFGGEQGSLLFAIRDFWQRYPSGYTFRQLDTSMAEATVWLWSPKAAAMDFRHYANRGYNQVYYEGYDHKGATPYGIACTSEFSVAFDASIIPSDEALCGFVDGVQHPTQYVGTPEFYHEMRAFGYWSLPAQDTETQRWLEVQLGKAVDFYTAEVEQRDWYGMFNYGDFMHTYDKERHQWRYDMGGYAWDNTELVPTLWLWLMFLRTGRADVFQLAEKLSRHASEVDVYHIGSYKGLGSRHNVRHWGCPCKEARIAMAAHHRFFYYMTGDYRMEDIFEELKDNELTFLNKDPLEAFYDKDKMVYPSHARSGPDWSSLCANWLTQWERFHDSSYKEKMEIGIADLKKAPLQLISGPDFEFDPKSVHLRYIGERAAGGTHLQICMGAPQVWLEVSDLLGDPQWTKMLADYGRFYYLDRPRQLAESDGIIGEREFSLPFMAAAMGAFGAHYFKDETLAQTTWSILLGAMLREGQCEGFDAKTLQNSGNKADLQEIPWISTNFVAQWCLNVITVLDFIGDTLPPTMDQACALVKKAPADGFRKA